MTQVKKILVRFSPSTSAKITERKILEFDPFKIKPREAFNVKVSSWDGFKNQFFAVLNSGGNYVFVEQLKSEPQSMKRKSQNSSERESPRLSMSNMCLMRASSIKPTYRMLAFMYLFLRIYRYILLVVLRMLDL